MPKMISYTDKNGKYFKSINDVIKYYSLPSGKIDRLKKTMNIKDILDMLIDCRKPTSKQIDDDMLKDNPFKDLVSKDTDRETLLVRYRELLSTMDLETLNSYYVTTVECCDYLRM